MCSEWKLNLSLENNRDSNKKVDAYNPTLIILYYI